MYDVELFHFLLMFYIGIATFNSFVSALLWYYYANRNFGVLCFSWLSYALGIAGIFNAYLTLQPYLYVTLLFSGLFPSIVLTTYVLARIGAVAFPVKRYVLLQLLGYGLTFGFYKMNAHTTLMAAPLVITTYVPLFIVSLKILISRNQSLTPITWLFTFTNLLLSLHGFDFIYCIDRPETIFAGLVLAMVLSVAISIFSTAAVVESLTIESEKLRKGAQKAAMVINDAKMNFLGEMAGGVAHEINNPLTIAVLQGNCLDRVLSRSDEVKSELIRPMIIKMIDAINRVVSIVHGLIAFARDDLNGPMGPVSVAEVVERTLKLCREKFIFQGIDLRVSDIDRSLMINAQSTQIQQIILNLLTNSLDAVKASKKKWIELTVLSSDGQVFITVCDTGPGVPKALRSEIFRPFFTTKDIGNGTGLGLSVSQGIAEYHLGSLVLNESPTQGGASFTLRLPLLRST